MKNHLSIFIILTIILISTILLFFMMKNNLQQKEIKNLSLDEKNYHVEIVRSEKDQRQGLSERDDMGDIDGMLFIYPDSQIRSFWMRNMRFDLDFVWIRDGKIIGFAENISYQDQEKSYVSPAECDMVLELPSGQIKKDNLQIGDKVELK